MWSGAKLLAAAVGVVAAGGAVLWAGTSCSADRTVASSPSRPLLLRATPAAPIQFTDFSDPVQRQTIINFAKTQLQWAETMHGASDRNIVDTIPRNGEVTRAWIVPEMGVATLSREDLGPGKGRIVWRIDITGDIGYAKMKLPPGRTYVMLDSLVMVSPDSGFGRVVYIPENPAHPVGTSRMRYTHHPEYGWNLPQARWAGAGSFHPWSNCDTHGCCEGWYCPGC